MEKTQKFQIVYVGPTNLCQHCTNDLARGIMTNERKQSALSKAWSFKHSNITSSFVIFLYFLQQVKIVSFSQRSISRVLILAVHLRNVLLFRNDQWVSDGLMPCWQLGPSSRREHAVFSRWFHSLPFYLSFSQYFVFLVTVPGKLFSANFPEDVIEALPKEFETGIYYGWAKVSNHGDVNKMVMSVGWNPYYKNEKKSMVSGWTPDCLVT